jgi:hypothetical protein
MVNYAKNCLNYKKDFLNEVLDGYVVTELQCPVTVTTNAKYNCFPPFSAAVSAFVIKKCVLKD